MQLTQQQLTRYKRNILLDNIGEAGQQKLLEAKVLVVGAGGLGSPVLLYLAAAGVGTLGICDADLVSLTNLQRQIIHTTQRIGHDKGLSAQQQIQSLNPDTCVRLHPCFLAAANAADIFKDYDFVIDATDNYDSKLLISDTCVALGKPFCHGALREYEGQLFTYVPGAADYRSFYGNVPPEMSAQRADQIGTLGAIAGIVGSLQAAECIKYLCGIGQLLTNRLFCINALTMQTTIISA